MKELLLIEMRDLLRSDAANPTGTKFDLGMWLAPSEPRTDDYKYIAGDFDPQAVGLPADWYVIPGAGGAQLRSIDIEQENMPKMSCGTMVCALGLAMVSGIFAKHGLTGTAVLSSSGGVALVPTCNGEDGFDAGAELFSISNEDSRYFFDPDCYYGTPREAEGELLVAQRIDDFINGIVDERCHPDYMDNDQSDED